jgi:hypothetical protein
MLDDLGKKVTSISRSKGDNDCLRYRMVLDSNEIQMKRITYNPKENSQDPAAWDIKDFNKIDEIEFHYFPEENGAGSYSLYPIKRE